MMLIQIESGACIDFFLKLWYSKNKKEVTFIKRITALFLVIIFTLSSCGDTGGTVGLGNQGSGLQESSEEAIETAQTIIEKTAIYNGKVLEYTEDEKTVYIKVSMNEPAQVYDTPNTRELDLMWYKLSAEEVFASAATTLLSSQYYTGFEVLSMDFETLEGEAIGSVSMNVSDAKKDGENLMFEKEQITGIIETWGINTGAEKAYTYNNMSLNVAENFDVHVDENGVFKIILEENKEFLFILLVEDLGVAEKDIDASLVVMSASYVNSFDGTDIKVKEVPLKIDNPALASSFTQEYNFKMVTANLILVFDGQDFYYIYYIYDENGVYSNEILKILESITFNA